MCTLTWLAQEDGWFVAFSRDERRARAHSSGPRLREHAGIRAISPIDGEAGGTWIAVNELGLTLALLNGYRFQDPAADLSADSGRWKSRGALVHDACDGASAAEVRARIAALDLGCYRPFELAAFDAKGDASLVSWTGSKLLQRALTGLDCPLVSSSLDDSGAREERRAQYATQVGSRSDVRARQRFHASHEPRRGALSPCMHREDAHTVSFSCVKVGASRVELSYQPQSPCAGMPVEIVEIPRRALAHS